MTPLVGHPVRVADGVWTLPGARAEAVLSPRADAVCLWSALDLRVYDWPSLRPRCAAATGVAGRLAALRWADARSLVGLVLDERAVTVVRWDADGGEALDAATLPPLAAAVDGLQLAPTGDWIATRGDRVLTGNVRAMGGVTAWAVALPAPDDSPRPGPPSRVTAWLSPDGDRAFVHDGWMPGVLDLRRGAVTPCTDEYDILPGRVERARWIRPTEMLCEWTGRERRGVRFFELSPGGSASDFVPHLDVSRRERADTFLCDPSGDEVLAAWIRPTGPQGWLRGDLWRVDVDEGVWTTRGTATPARCAGRYVDAAWCGGRALLAELRGRAGRGACHLTVDAGGPDARTLVPATAAAYDDLRVEAVGRGAVVRAAGRQGQAGAVKTWLVDVDAALAGTWEASPPAHDGEFAVRGGGSGR